MNIVIDAGMAGALFLNLPYSAKVENQYRRWRVNGDQVFAPVLWQVEVASILRREQAAAQITQEDARAILEVLPKLDIQIVSPDAGLLDSSLVWADKLAQTQAYDAQYLALAERLDAEFWTTSRRLFQLLMKQPLKWVKSCRNFENDYE